ncbi:MAG: hypothetical protein RL199_1033 [Pseudomonadota bacterium]|jgi:hypothetical protein
MTLFHLIADAGSAHVRRELTARGLLEGLSFKNLHYEVHRQAFEALGGRSVPALLDGEVLHEGEAACLALLEAKTAS